MLKKKIHEIDEIFGLRKENKVFRVSLKEMRKKNIYMKLSIAKFDIMVTWFS